MRIKFTGILFVICSLLFSKIYGQLKYPTTKKVIQEDDYFGTKVSDPYRWLEYDSAEDTKQWINTEQSFTENYLSFLPFRHLLKRQVEKAVNFPRYYAGFKAGEYIFFSKTMACKTNLFFIIKKA